MKDKYILYWGDGDGCTYHSYYAQPFETDDIDSWEYNLITVIEKAKSKDEYNITYDKIQLPIGSIEFSYEIMDLNDWFTKNLIK
jgi:hypothetical protein